MEATSAASALLPASSSSLDASRCAASMLTSEGPLAPDSEDARFAMIADTTCNHSFASEVLLMPGSCKVNEAGADGGAAKLPVLAAVIAGSARGDVWRCCCCCCCASLTSWAPMADSSLRMRSRLMSSRSARDWGVLELPAPWPWCQLPQEQASEPLSGLSRHRLLAFAHQVLMQGKQHSRGLVAAMFLKASQAAAGAAPVKLPVWHCSSANPAFTKQQAHLVLRGMLGPAPA